MEVKLHVTGESTTGTDIIAKVFQAKGRDFKDVSLDDPLVDEIRQWIYQPYDPDEDVTADIPINNIRELVAYIKVFEGNIKSLSIKDKDTGFDYWASISDEIRSQPEINTEVASNERLKETAKIAIQEIGAWSRKAGKLEAENERLKAWILKIKEYARSISVIVVRYCEDALKEASSVKENQE